MKFMPKGESVSNLIFGAYFKSENDITTDYLIWLSEGEVGRNVTAKIYTTDIPSNHFDSEGLKNGDVVAFYDWDTELICEIKLWGKYFFPKFSDNLQLYYDDKKYYNGKHSTNQITSLMECINYAIEYALTTKQIKPY